MESTGRVAPFLLFKKRSSRTIALISGSTQYIEAKIQNFDLRHRIDSVHSQLKLCSPQFNNIK